MSVTMVLNSVTEEDSSTFRDVERPGGQSTSVNKTSWGRMQNTVVAATSKLKSSYVDVVFTLVCITTS